MNTEAVYSYCSVKCDAEGMRFTKSENTVLSQKKVDR